MPVITSSNNTHLPKNIVFSLSDKAPQVLKIPRNELVPKSRVMNHRTLAILTNFMMRQRLCISISWSGECGADCCRSFDLGFVKRFFTCFLSSESRETRPCVPSSSVTSLYRLADRTEYHRHRSYTLNFRDE
ncbi:hypothetical protein FOBRF1_009987 [Fusarium oxysporum]